MLNHFEKIVEIALKELIVISTKRQNKSFFKILNKNVTLDSPKIRPHRRCLVCMLVDDFCRSAISTLLRQVVFYQSALEQLTTTLPSKIYLAQHSTLELLIMNCPEFAKLDH